MVTIGQKAFCGILETMSQPAPEFFQKLAAGFSAPIHELDCGKKCAPHNERGVPFCCDTAHMVPTAYDQEWAYLQVNTDLWHQWRADDPIDTARLEELTPEGQVLIACQGHTRCQRDFRALTCRSFPFFPYLTSGHEFIGLSLYWEYADRCWVISNLNAVTAEYRKQFVAAFDQLFEQLPVERESFAHQSAAMRRAFTRRGRTIPLLHRNGGSYKISPRGERLRRVLPEAFPKFGPYAVAQTLPFPDELAPH